VALVESALRTSGSDGWVFEVAAAATDFRDYRKRLDPELMRVRPRVLVCQCPGGPSCPTPSFPRWARALMTIERRLLARLIDAHVATEVRSDPDRTRHDARYEGRYLDRVSRWEPSNWPVVGPIWRTRVSRYLAVPKLTCEGYVQRILDLRERARTAGVRQVLFIGLLPIAEDVCPGHRVRAPGWCAALRGALDDPENGSRFLDIHGALADLPLDRLLLKDRTHLSEDGHRRVAALVAPVLAPLLTAAN
jgi:hypothetical protein